MEKRYWFVAQTYVNLVGADVSYFASKNGPYGMHTTPDVDDENIIYFLTEDAARRFAYEGIANTDRTVHVRYLSKTPKQIMQ